MTKHFTLILTFLIGMLIGEAMILFPPKENTCIIQEPEVVYIDAQMGAEIICPEEVDRCDDAEFNSCLQELDRCWRFNPSVPKINYGAACESNLKACIIYQGRMNKAYSDLEEGLRNLQYTFDEQVELFKRGCKK